ncbi:MAG: hypothetical protein ABFS10_09685 [Bacteroidota bacterium]
MKNRYLFIFAAAAGLAGLLPGCDLIEECGQCEMVTIEDGIETRGTPLPYCGEELEDKKNSPPQTIGGVTTYWVCN